MATAICPSAFESCLLQGGIDFVFLVLSYWPIISILRLKSVNFLLKCLVDGYCRCRWDIDSFLLNWFKNPMDFRAKLAQCDGIVSGSQVLQFLDRTHYIDSDFDIFLRPEGALEMGRWLQTCGYVYLPSSSAALTFDYAFHLIIRHLLSQKLRHYGYTDKSIITIFNFRRLDVVGEIPKNSGLIQIVVVQRNPIKHVLNFHSSLCFILTFDLTF
jgi:hypothetical protein